MGHRRRLVPRRVVALHPQPAAAADQRAVTIDHAPIEQDRAIADAADRAALDIGDRPDRGDVRQILFVIGVYRHPVGIGAPATTSRSAVGHDGAADQAYAAVTFACYRAAVLPAAIVI